MPEVAGPLVTPYYKRLHAILNTLHKITISIPTFTKLNSGIRITRKLKTLHQNLSQKQNLGTSIYSEKGR